MWRVLAWLRRLDPPEVDEGWRVLGRQVAAERGRRWRSRSAFARHAGLSRRVVDDIERGVRDNYSEGTLSALEAGLGWSPGSALRIVQGGRARRDIDATLAELLDLWPRLSADARRMLVELARRSLGG